MEHVFFAAILGALVLAGIGCIRRACAQHRRIAAAATPARVECSWCGDVIRGGCEPVTHGICPQCRAELVQRSAAR